MKTENFTAGVCSHLHSGARQWSEDVHMGECLASVSDVPYVHDDRFHPIRLQKVREARRPRALPSRRAHPRFSQQIFKLYTPGNDLVFNAFGDRLDRLPMPWIPRGGMQPIAMHGYKYSAEFLTLHWMSRVFGDGV